MVAVAVTVSPTVTAAGSMLSSVAVASALTSTFLLSVLLV